MRINQMTPKTGNIHRLFLFLFVGTANLSGQAYAMLPEALDVYEKAIHVSPLVKKIHEDGVERRQAEALQLTKILNSIHENQTQDPEKLREIVIHSLEQDKRFFESVNQQLEAGSYEVGKKGTTFQLLYNRMPIITEEALKLAQTGNIFFDVLDRQLPQGYSIEAPKFNYFSESNHIYSHGRRGNALKSLLLKIWQIQNDKFSLSAMSQFFWDSWLETAPFVHITPLPDDFDISHLELSPHFFSDVKTPKGFLTIHNGYAFGGHRDEARYPKGKKWGPQDCSSFVATYTECKTIFSTYNQAQYFQEVNGFQFKHLGEGIVNRWEGEKVTRQNDVYLQSVREVLSPLAPNPDPQSLKPGLVHAERSYTGISSKPDIALTGTGGHTGILLGTIGSASETQVLTISANRDLEGSGKEFVFGVEPRPLFSTPERMIMFFDIKH